MAYSHSTCLVSLIISIVLFFSTTEAVEAQTRTQPPRNYEGCIEKCRHMNLSDRDVACANSDLETIPNEVACHQAVVLDLKRNNIKGLQQGVFRGFTELEILLLDDNKITSISLGVLQDLVRLRSLHIARNNLTTLQEGVFDGLGTSLSKRLIISSNQISQITRGVFGTLTLLRNLYLDGNMVRSIEVGSFEGMAELRNLFLMGNRISRIASGTFTGLRQLEILNLSENPIVVLEDGAFEGLPQLGTLKLQHNEIESLGDNRFLFRMLQRQSFSIRVEGNPLYCNCSNEALRLWYRNHVKTADQAACHAPPEYADVPLTSIEDTLQCPKVAVAESTVRSELGNQDSLKTDSSASFGTTIGLIVLAGCVLCAACVFVVVRRYRKQARGYGYRGEKKCCPQPELGDATRDQNTAEGYHLVVQPGDDTAPAPPPSGHGHVFRTVERQESPDAEPSSYLSVREINHRLPSGLPGEELPNGAPPPPTSTPHDDSCPLVSGCICKMPPITNNSRTRFHEVHEPPSEVQYTTVDHRKSPRR